MHEQFAADRRAGGSVAIAGCKSRPPDRTVRTLHTYLFQVDRFTVTAIGTVRDAVVVDSEPETVFDDAALKAIARWRYNPRVENGEAVERPGLQTVIRFELEN